MGGDNIYVTTNVPDIVFGVYWILCHRILKWAHTIPKVETVLPRAFGLHPIRIKSANCQECLHERACMKEKAT